MINLTKDDAIDILRVLSMIDGFVIAIDASNKSMVFEELSRISEILSEKIKDNMQ
jgi:hypothetical protein